MNYISLVLLYLSTPSLLLLIIFLNVFDNIVSKYECNVSLNLLTSITLLFKLWSTSPLTTTDDVSLRYPNVVNWSNVLDFNLFSYAFAIILLTYFWCDNFFCS